MTMLVPGARNTLTVGGLVMSTKNLIILRSMVTANTYSVFYNNSFGVTASVYLPSGSLAFYPRAYRWVQTSASAATVSIALFYADTNLTFNSGSAPTNPVGILAGSTAPATVGNGEFMTTGQVIAGAGQSEEGVVGGKSINGKYLHLATNGSFGVMWLYGYEAA